MTRRLAPSLAVLAAIAVGCSSAVPLKMVAHPVNIPFAGVTLRSPTAEGNMTCAMLSAFNNAPAPAFLDLAQCRICHGSMEQGAVTSADYVASWQSANILPAVLCCGFYGVTGTMAAASSQADGYAQSTTIGTGMTYSGKICWRTPPMSLAYIKITMTYPNGYVAGPWSFVLSR